MSDPNTVLPVSRSTLIDGFGRRVTYARVSITDRCDFRCIYCMSENMVFLPRPKILTLEEIFQVSEALVSLGVEKIRITGGEPLVRKGAMGLIRQIGGLPGLRELVITTNGSRLADYSAELKASGIRRINVSLDSLKADRFRQLTRVGELQTVLGGIKRAQEEGLSVKINAVILKGRNDDEICDLVRFAVDRGLDISFIEEMPLGVVNGHDRAEAFCSSEVVRTVIAEAFELTPSVETTGGPARYFRVAGSGSRVGFISPHSHNFCHACNRIRITAEGRLLLCLGNEHSVDLKTVLRDEASDQARLRQCIQDAMRLKPERHHFEVTAQPVILRHMNATGG